MNCSQIQELLSDYYDNELCEEDRQHVEAHLKTCDRCAESLAAFESLSLLAGKLSAPTPPAGMWGELEARLQEKSQEAGSVVLSEEKHRPPFRWYRKYSRVIAVAILLLAVGVGYLNFAGKGHGTHHHADGVFNQYLTAFEKNPDSAQQILLKHYQHNPVQPQQAARLLGYQPVIAQSVPAGYEVQSSYVMKMPCCTCLQTVCKRKDGSCIVIFEHDDETPEWFEGQPKIKATCNGEKCCLVNLDQDIAASWQHGKRHITVIGIRDVNEVNTLVAWSDQDRNKS